MWYPWRSSPHGITVCSASHRWAAQPCSICRLLQPSLLQKFLETKSRGAFYGINRGVGKAGSNTAFPLSISNYSFLEPKWINLTYYSQPDSFIHGMTLPLSNIPAAPQCMPLAVTVFEFIACWEIIVLQVWQSNDYSWRRWPRDVMWWPLCWPYLHAIRK